MAASKRGSAPASGCPICGRPVVRGRGAAAIRPGPGKPAADPFPFCSARCQLVDLGCWLDEDYRIPDRETVVWAGPDRGPGDGGDGDGDDRT